MFKHVRHVLEMRKPNKKMCMRWNILRWSLWWSLIGDWGRVVLCFVTAGVHYRITLMLGSAFSFCFLVAIWFSLPILFFYPSPVTSYLSIRQICLLLLLWWRVRLLTLGGPSLLCADTSTLVISVQICRGSSVLLIPFHTLQVSVKPHALIRVVVFMVTRPLCISQYKNIIHIVTFIWIIHSTHLPQCSILGPSQWLSSWTEESPSLDVALPHAHPSLWLTKRNSNFIH